MEKTVSTESASGRGDLAMGEKGTRKGRKVIIREEGEVIYRQKVLVEHRGNARNNSQQGVVT